MTIKLTNAQLETLKNVADPNYKSYRHTYWEHSSCFHYFAPSLKVLAKHGLVDLIYRHTSDKYPDSVQLTLEGRVYLDGLGIAPVALKPPAKKPVDLEVENERMKAALTAIGQEIAIWGNTPQAPELNTTVALVATIEELTNEALK